MCLFGFNILFILNSYALDHKADSVQVGLKKNVISITLGTAAIYGIVNGNYERIFSQKKTGFIKYYLMRYGFGWYESYGSPGYNAIAGISGLSGLGKRHLELNLGVAAMFNWNGYHEEDSNDRALGKTLVIPAGAIGYRFQKPGGSFIFRTGVGFPESFYVSFGFCF